MLSTSIVGQPPAERPAMIPPPQPPTGQQTGRSFSGGNMNRAPQTPNQPQPQRQGPPQYGQTSRPPQGPPARTTTPNQIAAPRPGPAPAPAPAPQPGTIPESVGFFSARAVNQLPEINNQATSNARIGAPQGQQAFNPKLESPSIRKTPGIDHSSSKPLARSGQHIPPPPASQAPGPVHANTSSFTPVRPSMPGSQSSRGNVVNPSLDQTRRIGAPMGSGSPLANRGSYRPPTMKRPPPGDTNAGRAPLADLPANPNSPTLATAAAATGVEAKRQKMA